MRTACSFLLTSVLLFSVAAFAVELTTAKVVAVKDYSSGRIAFYEQNLPIYDGYPVYDITIRADGRDYLVRYESLTGYYPSAWNVGSEIKVKQEHGQFILMNGAEAVKARIVSSSECVPVNGPPSVITVLPAIPCE